MGADLTLSLRGEVDHANAPILDGHLQAARKDARGDLTVDLREVTFLDSMALASLLALHRAWPGTGGVLRYFHSDSTNVRRSFSTTGLEQVLPFED